MVCGITEGVIFHKPAEELGRKEPKHYRNDILPTDGSFGQCCLQQRATLLIEDLWAATRNCHILIHDRTAAYRS